MKTILITFLLFLGLSTVLIGVVGIVTSFPKSGLPVEILQDPRTSFSDEALRAILESDDLRRAYAPQLLILGASGAQEAFRPSEVQRGQPSYQVNNLSIGAANISEIVEVVDHCLKAMPARVRKDSAILLGLSYPLFVRDETRWKHPDFVSPSIVASGLFISDLKREAMRNPLVLDSGNPVFKALPGPIISLAKWRCGLWAEFGRKYPENPGDPLLKWKGWKWRLPNRHAGNRSHFPPKQKKLQRDAPSPIEQMEWLSDYMGSEPGTLFPEQFDQLSSLIRKTRSKGMKVFIVEMPLPSWHRAGSPYFAPFRERLRETLSTFNEDNGVIFLDLSESVDDADFRDSAHPTKESHPAWARNLNSALQNQNPTP